MAQKGFECGTIRPWVKPQSYEKGQPPTEEVDERNRYRSDLPPSLFQVTKRNAS